MSDIELKMRIRELNLSLERRNNRINELETMWRMAEDRIEELEANLDLVMGLLKQQAVSRHSPGEE